LQGLAVQIGLDVVGRRTRQIVDRILEPRAKSIVPRTAD
jgi:hypothetical protein